jgi:hypothetical protein
MEAQLRSVYSTFLNTTDAAAAAIDGNSGPDGVDRDISDCHFAAQLNHFIPGFLSRAVAVLLK